MEEVNLGYVDDRTLSEVVVPCEIGTGRRGATLSFHDIEYFVETPGKCFEKTEKQLLFGVR